MNPIFIIINNKNRLNFFVYSLLSMKSRKTFQLILQKMKIFMKQYLITGTIDSLKFHYLRIFKIIK